MRLLSVAGMVYNVYRKYLNIILPYRHILEHVMKLKKRSSRYPAWTAFAIVSIGTFYDSPASLYVILLCYSPPPAIIKGLTIANANSRRSIRRRIRYGPFSAFMRAAPMLNSGTSPSMATPPIHSMSR